MYKESLVFLLAMVIMYTFAKILIYKFVKTDNKFQKLIPIIVDLVFIYHLWIWGQQVEYYGQEKVFDLIYLVALYYIVKKINKQ